jgi:NDP-sugar pyrophosphorylase family protein
LINVVVPMAGRGSRFDGTAERGPKPLIEVRPGRTMLDYVADYLHFDEPYRLIFVCLAEHARDARLESLMRRVGPPHRLLVTEHITNGPAATALLAHDLLEDGDELIVAYCDSAHDLDMQQFVDRMRQREADGGLLIFPSNEPRHAYARLTGDRIDAVAEKQVVSTDAVAGVYYFRRARAFTAAAPQLLDQATDEVFVSSTYNPLIAAGGRVLGERIAPEQRIEMGTPADLRASRTWLAQAHAGALAASK